jgi:hypothetical protein
MARKRRQFEVFSMSFLDCMSCGFGAVILFFMIINAQVKESTEEDPTELMAETKRLEVEILEGRKDLVLAKNTTETLEEEKQTAEGKIAEIIALIKELREELAEYDDETLAKIERIEKLQSDINAEGRRGKPGREDSGIQGRRRPPVPDGAQAGRRPHTDTRRSFGEHAGRHDRQYHPPSQHGGSGQTARAVKWRQVVASVDWLTSQFKPGSKFQIYMFNNEVQPVIKGSGGTWLEADDATKLDEAIRVLRRTPPENGTNLRAAYEIAAELTPRPDNIILLVDGLPTMMESTTNRRMVTGRDRMSMHGRSVRELPSGIPVNILLFPMEGDYDAAIAYWTLAYGSGGSFMAVSRDWP